MTAKRCPENERIKRRYLQFLSDVKGRDEASLDAVAKAIERFDEYNRRGDFKKFHIEQARAFKAHRLRLANSPATPRWLAWIECDALRRLRIRPGSPRRNGHNA